MTNRTMAEMIANHRKELGLTQKDLAEKLNITDKAVSKWERGIACPDTATIPKLAQILGITIEELMTSKTAEPTGHRGVGDLADLILKAVPLAMGVAVTVTAVLGELDVVHGLSMLGIGMICIGIRQMKNT